MCCFSAFAMAKDAVTSDVSKDNQIQQRAEQSSPQSKNSETQQKVSTFAQKISKIEYIGYQRVEKETLESYLPIQVGDEYDESVFNESLKALYATGFYEEVNIDMKNGVLTVTVKEYPIINKVSFEGNSKISDTELNDAVKLKIREVISPAKIKEIQQQLLETYRNMGRYNASVNPKIIKLDNNRVNLVFEINEGKSAGIDKINFVGNENFSSGELRDVISSKIKRWYRFFVHDDIYDNNRLNEDKALLYRFYRENGYANIQIRSSIAELSSDKKGFVITFTIDEGDIYTIDKVDVKSHVKKLKVDGLMDDFYCKKGDMYNIVLIDADLSDLIKKVGSRGFASVRIMPEVIKDPLKKKISVIYHIAEGNKMYISKIIIKGNTKTRDNIIRREIPIHEGDALNETLISTAESNIRRLGFFKTVNVETVPDANAPDKCVVEVNVEEQSTAEAVVSASYSTLSGVGLELAYNERNFFGTGKTFGVSIGSGKARTGREYKEENGKLVQVNRTSKFKFFNSVVVNAADPHFLDKDMEGSISAYKYSQSRFDGFSTDELGTTVGVSYALTPKIQQGWDYTINKRSFTDIAPYASPIIRYQTMKHEADGSVSNVKPEKSLLSSVKHSISYSTSFLTGLKGFFKTGLNTTFAGVGGDAKHLKNEVFGAYAFPVWKKATLKFGATYGLLTKIGNSSPLIADSFALGLDSFRGFDDCGFGPNSETTREITTIDLKTAKVGKKPYVTRDYIGASQYWKGTVELKFPVGFPEELQFRGFTFTDFGTAWDAPEKGKDIFTQYNGEKNIFGGDKITYKYDADALKNGPVVGHKIDDSKKIRVSVGLGVSFLTPFGPMVFTYAIPVVKEKNDIEQRFLVGFKTSF